MTDTPMIGVSSSSFLRDFTWVTSQHTQAQDQHTFDLSSDTTNVDPKRPLADHVSSQVDKFLRAAAVTMALSAYQAQADDLSTSPIRMPEHPTWLTGSKLSAQAAISDLDELFPREKFNWSLDKYVAERAAESYCEFGDAHS